MCIMEMHGPWAASAWALVFACVFVRMHLFVYACLHVFACNYSKNFALREIRILIYISPTNYFPICFYIGYKEFQFGGIYQSHVIP